MTEPTTFLNAAETILADAGRPMTSKEITEEALRRGLIRTTGKTPEKTMDAALYTQAKSAGPSIVRLSKPGQQRSVRGTVRWTLAGS